MKRSDWEELQATWNVYKTGSSWGTAGATGSADIETSNPAQAQATLPGFDVAGWVTWTITAIAQDAVTNCGGKVRLLLYPNAYGGDGVGGYRDHRSSDYIADTSKRPKLDITYTPPPSPVVTSQAPTYTAGSTATFNGNVTDQGATSIIERGFVWDTSTHADPGNVAPGSSGYANLDAHEHGTWTPGTGAFDEEVTGLVVGTTVYYRAYAKNDENQYDYSNTEQSFVVLATHRISNDGTSGIKKGGTAVAAKVFIVDAVTETLSVKTADGSGMYTNDVYTAGDVIPKIHAFAVHDEKATLEHGSGDSKLTFTAKATDADHWYPGAEGNKLTIALVDDGTAGSETVDVTAPDIVVHMEAGVSTADEIVTAIEGDEDADAMVGVVAGGDGTGVVAALAETALAGGAYYTSTAHVFVTPTEI